VKPATWPPDEPDRGRLLLIDPRRGTHDDLWLEQLPSLLGPGDLLVVNDAATLPASLHGTVRDCEPLELRLAARGPSDSEWTAVLFGPGDWRMRTEDRPAPVPVAGGDALEFGADLHATVVGVSEASPRLLEVRFELTGAALWRALYARGRPVQYSHLDGPLALWHVQTAYGSRPWAVEAPSAGRPLSFRLLADLGRRGVGLAWITHAAGLSSTGDPALDALLPLPERFDVPEATVAAIEATRRSGGRVVAVGTTVVRALEGASAQSGGALEAGTGVTSIRLGPGFPLRVVAGVLTGIHEPGTSHFALLGAFAAEEVLLGAARHAEEASYLAHEFGDSSLILAAA
jgi:S-adenosylmethionine:tRNA ribosyltransferase-isomerase